MGGTDDMDTLYTPYDASTWLIRMQHQSKLCTTLSPDPVT